MNEWMGRIFTIHNSIEENNMRRRSRNCSTWRRSLIFKASGYLVCTHDSMKCAHTAHQIPSQTKGRRKGWSAQPIKLLICYEFTMRLTTWDEFSSKVFGSIPTHSFVCCLYLVVILCRVCVNNYTVYTVCQLKNTHIVNSKILIRICRRRKGCCWVESAHFKRTPR